MASRRKSDEDTPVTSRKPATTPEGVENQMVVLAIRLAEKQLMDGTASAQVISHYLKLASSTEKLVQERMMYETALIKAKAEAMEGAKATEALYKEALNAMRLYQGQEPNNED